MSTAPSRSILGPAKALDNRQINYAEPTSGAVDCGGSESMLVDGRIGQVGLNIELTAAICCILTVL